MQDAQKACPARPQASRNPEAYPLGYVEDLDDDENEAGRLFQHPVSTASRRHPARHDVRVHGPQCHGPRE